MLNLFFQITLVCLLSISSLAEEPGDENKRLSGFAEHHNRQSRFEKAREKGEREHLEEKDQAERQRERALEDHKKVKKQSVMSEEGPEAKADALAKKKLEQEYEESHKIYLKEKARQTNKIKRSPHLPTEEEELNLYSDRPRYDYKKRVDFGGTPKYGGKSSTTAGGFSRGSGGGSFGAGRPSGGNSLPAPPSFEPYNGDVEPPPIIDDFGDIPPPPPPPDFEMDGGGDDFPPPPPPPVFDGSGDF